LAGLLALGVALPAVVGFLAGTLELPRNDDWVYRRIALELAQTGVLALHGVTTMMFGQIVLTQPFLWLSGPQPWGFAAAGIVFAAAAVVCSYLLARQFLPPLRAAVATSLLLLFPAYLAYATSFMTDVPAIAAQSACLALGAIALHRRPIWNRWLLASAAVGCLAFSIREFAIAAPASVLVSAIITEPRRFREWALAIAVVGFCGFLYLLKSAPGQDAGILVGTGALYLSTYAVSSISLVLLPAALIGGMWWRHEWARRDVAIGAELGLLIVGIRLVQLFRDGAMPPVLLGNPASPWGAPGIPYLIGGRPLLFDETAWAMLGLLALVATVVVLSVGTGIAGAYLRRSDGSWRAVIKQIGSPIGPLLLFSIAVVAGLTLYGRQFALFERYYWPLVVPMATLFMYRPNGYSPQAATASPRVELPVAASVTAFFTFISVVSLIFMLNSFAFDSARWRGGERLVQLGIQPDDVDAGYEWVGFHQPDLPGPYETLPVQTFYDTLWPGRRECGIVTSQKTGPTGAALVGTVGYSLLLITGPEELLYLYRVTSPDCVPRSAMHARGAAYPE
jgi:4-amino-4-deoxy-L-arabinose transferase-like glycosyltransferase